MTQTSKPLTYFSLFLWLGVLILILAGGLVTSKEAGLAVPDWPLSYGMVFPPMVGNVAWEHGHRMIAGTIGILTLILTFWIQKTESRVWLKKLAWYSLLAVVIQALLGGLTVKMLLPWQVSVTHACLAQIFFCMITAIAYFLNPVYASSCPLSGESAPKLKRLSKLTVAFIFIQLVLGAMIRHNGHMHAVVTHILWAFVVLAHVILVNSAVMQLPAAKSEAPLLGPTTMLMGFLTLIQLFLGFGSFIFTRMLERSYTPSFGEVAFTASHQTTGALILAFSVLVAIIAGRK